MVTVAIVGFLAWLILIVGYETIMYIDRNHVRRVGGLIFFRFGRFGGSFYISAR